MTPEQKKILSQLVLQDPDEEEAKGEVFAADKDELKMRPDGHANKHNILDVHQEGNTPELKDIFAGAPTNVDDSDSKSVGLEMAIPTTSAVSQPGAYSVEGIGGSARDSDNRSTGITTEAATTGEGEGNPTGTGSAATSDHQEPPALDLTVPIEASLVRSTNQNTISLDLSWLDIEIATPTTSHHSFDTKQQGYPPAKPHHRIIWGITALVALIGLVLIPILVFRPNAADPTTDETSTPPLSPVDTPKQAPMELYYPPLPFLQELWQTTVRAVQEDPDSPQYKANAWMAQDPHIETYTWWRLHQRFALAVKYFALDGPNWHRNDHWLSYEVSECDWYSSYHNTSAVCDEEGHILIEDLHNNTLNGTILMEMFICPFGAYFDMSHNQLHGTLPTLLSTNVLEVFRISHNDLEGPLTVEAGFFAENIRIVDISQNAFVGQFMLNVFPSLESLDISYNLFEGEIPTDLETMSSLQLLDISHNLYQGSLPSELGYLTSLQALDVSGNQHLSGVVQPMLPHSLEALNISGTTLTGTIPPDLCNRAILNISADCGQVLHCCSI